MPNSCRTAKNRENPRSSSETEKASFEGKELTIKERTQKVTVSWPVLHTNGVPAIFLFLSIIDIV